MEGQSIEISHIQGWAKPFVLIIAAAVDWPPKTERTREMTYISGFLLAVPTENKAAYKKMAEEAWPIFKSYGCLSMRENWGNSVPDGTVTSFPMAVKKEENETVVFSWMEWPDQETCERGFAAMMEDPRMKDMPKKMPFDGMRMMWGGFEELVRFD
jgi:uncharacterized protein YbaA (DUF1428 family)